MSTLVYVNRDGLDFTSPMATPKSVAKNSSSGYVIFNDYTVEWTGTNLKYSNGYNLPTSGIIKSYTATKLGANAVSELIYSLSCNYTIRPSDTSVSANKIFFAIASKDNIQWKGGNDDDKFYFNGNNCSIDGSAGTDTISLSQNFSYYLFSNLNIKNSSATIYRPDLKVCAYLTSIEKFVFKDKTIFFSDIPPDPNNVAIGTVIIKGLSTWGITLSITNTIKDIDGLDTFSYKWQNDNGSLSTNATYTLTETDVGTKVWVTVSYNDKKGNLEEVKSNLIDVTISTKASAVNDILTGTDREDKLSSLAGNDTLLGGFGADKLTGGLGADIFKYTSIDDSGVAVKTRDTITDFKHSESDKIDLSAIDANSTLPSDQSFTFIGTNPFGADATAQLRLDPKTGILYGSTNADNTPEFSILLSGVKSLVPEDFVL